MKRFLTTSFLAAAAGSAALLLNGCGKSETPATSPTKSGMQASAEKTSFQEVTSQLDPGGSLYLYLSTEQLVEGVSGKMTAFKSLLDSIPDMKPDDRDKLDKGFGVLTRVVAESGIEDVSGLGMSSIAREPGFYHGKVLVHHYKGKGSGFLWTMFGQKPHALDGLNLLPATTVFATCSDLDVAMLWSLVKKEASQSEFPQAQQVLERLPQSFEKATGLSWDKVLASLGGEYEFAITLDDTRMVTLPLPGQPMQIPDPALMLVAKVKDDTVFNRIDEALKQTGMQIATVDRPNLRMRTLALPIPLPIQVRPTVARSGDYLFIASTDSLVQEALAVQSGTRPGLKTTPEFQRLAKDIPEQGNQFTYLSQRFGQTIVQVQKQALGNLPKAQGQWFGTLLNTNQVTFTYSVGACTDEGWLGVSNGNQHPAKMLLAGAVVPVAVASAVAIPSLVKARQAAQKRAQQTSNN